MKPLTALAVLLLVLLFGLALATVSISREQQTPSDLSGSPTPPEFMPRTVDNLLGSGDFVTRAPDGEAFVQMHFGSPQAFDRIVHTYVTEVWPPYRIRKAAIKTSD